jgi:hypothetical protein
MPEQRIVIVYDGGDATKNTIDAKLFGQSLQGIDKLISDALIVYSQERLPKRGERAPLILKAREPEAGSYTIVGFLQDASVLLPLGIPYLSQVGVDIASHYVQAALDYFRGDDDSMERIVDTMARMHQETVVANDRADERRHTETMGMQDLFRRSITSNGPAAIDFVAPMGRSVSTASFAGSQNAPLLVSVEDADLIRDSEKLTWSEVRNLVLETDGFKFHTNGLSVVNPEREGFLMADVNDPAFEEEANVYTNAAQQKAKIEVLARRGYKDAKLVKIQILDFVGEINDESL